MRTIIYAIIGYFFLLLTVRLLNRRPGAQMTPFEFVIIFLIGGVSILATVGDDHSVINGVCAVTTIAFLHRTVSWLRERFPTLGAIIDGTPLVLIQNGEWQSEAMQKTMVDEIDVMAAARAQGLRSLHEIKYAVRERNGGISIIKRAGADNGE
jgi:uncharacterized membrane protein YcaP (DUF421 family)